MTRIRRQTLVVGIIVALFGAIGALLFMPIGSESEAAAAAPIDPTEQARTIAALRPSKRARPVIAILAHNSATEITDLLLPFGVLKRADVAEVAIVAERDAPIGLFPVSRFGLGPELARIAPQRTLAVFDARFPEGADYVLVPAVMPRDDPAQVTWLKRQHDKGATIISICAGALTVGAAGLFDDRRATTHWSYAEELREAHPKLRWVNDRRYVASDRVGSTTGISASLPLAVALVEAIGGRAKAEQVAADLGLTNWDARHSSAAFRLTAQHRQTFVRNWLSFWRKERTGVPVANGVDEIALALTADVWSRTGLSIAQIEPDHPGPIATRHGLALLPPVQALDAKPDRTLSPLPADRPAEVLDRSLAEVAARFGRRSAAIVALQLEYPWPNRAGSTGLSGR